MPHVSTGDVRRKQANKHEQHTCGCEDQGLLESAVLSPGCKCELLSSSEEGLCPCTPAQGLCFTCLDGGLWTWDLEALWVILMCLSSAGSFFIVYHEMIGIISMDSMVLRLWNLLESQKGPGCLKWQAWTSVCLPSVPGSAGSQESLRLGCI